MKTQNIPFKSELAPIKNIKERNEKFHALPDEQKRKEIAYDCLSLILIGAVQGSYLDYWGGSLKFLKVETAEELQTELVTNLPQCRVCARGGMMLSQIRLGNQLSLYDRDIQSGNRNIVKGFTMKSFSNMEYEYETSLNGHPYHSNTTEKLANICCNVIANGDFNTEDLTDYLVEWNIEIMVSENV